MTEQHWAQRVGQALEGALDFEPLWEELGQAIAAAPQDVGLLRLRLQLAEAAGLRHEHLADLRRLSELLPQDRDLRLALAVRQHRLAWFIVDDDLDEDAQQAERERLEGEALRWILDLARQHLADGAFMAELLGEQQQALATQPWTRLRLLLQALAASPGSVPLSRLLALAWCGLADTAPEGAGEEGAAVPMGFCSDAFGTLWEPLMIERALAALAPLLHQDPADAELLARRARLLAACGRFDEAAADHAAAGAAWAARAAAAATDDERAEALQHAEAAQDAARLHAAGPQAVIEAAMSGIEDAIGRLGGGAQADPRYASLPAELQQSLAEMEAGLASTRDALAGDFAELQQQVHNPWAEPDEPTRAELDDAAARVARSSGGLVSFEPASVLALDDASIEQPLDDWLQATGTDLEALGWRRLAWCEYPAYRAMFGRQVVGGLWVDAAGTSLAAVTAAGAVRAVDVESELQGGLQLITTAGRGRSNFGGVPGIDQLAVEPQMPVGEMVALHQARLACQVAGQPDGGARVFGGVGEFEAMQERQRQLKLDFRLREGLSRFEALGIPVTHPGYFVPVVQEEVRRALQRVARALGGG